MSKLIIGISAGLVAFAFFVLFLSLFTDAPNNTIIFGGLGVGVGTAFMNTLCAPLNTKRRDDENKQS